MSTWNVVSVNEEWIFNSGWFSRIWTAARGQRPPQRIAQLSNFLINSERANKGTPVGLKAEARKKVELSTLNYSSPIRRRHQEQREKRERERQKPTQPNKIPLTQPSSQLQMGHTTLFPEKIYLSIFLEPRKNNNILQEKRHKYSHHPLTLYFGIC